MLIYRSLLDSVLFLREPNVYKSIIDIPLKFYIFALLQEFAPMFVMGSVINKINDMISVSIQKNIDTQYIVNINSLWTLIKQNKLIC